mgnify:CR=1 FL=1
MACVVCTELFNTGSRTSVTCPACAISVCRLCVAQYLCLDTTIDVGCLSCKQPWSRQFMFKNMTKKFMAIDYRDIRERIVFDRERSRLPAILPYVRCKKRIDVLKTVVNGFNSDKNDTINLLRINDDSRYEITTGTKKQTLRENKTEHRRLKLLLIHQKREGWLFQRKLNREYQFMNSPARYGHDDPSTSMPIEIETQEKKQDGFITRGHCPMEGCNSFIEANWSCTVCNTKVCSKCLDIALLDHVCNEDTIATMAAIRADCKPCPTCRVRVFRVHGCNQMWCTNCNNAFDWRSGESITVVHFHNPHYAEWVRTQPVSTRETVGATVGVRECVDITRLTHYILRLIDGTMEDKGEIMEILGTANHIIDLPRVDDAEEMAIRKKCIEFVSNEINEATFRCDIQRIDKRIEKKREVAEVLMMFATVSKEKLLDCYTNSRPASVAIEVINNELRPYTLDTIKEISEWYGGKTVKVSIHTTRSKLLNQPNLTENLT